jgi:hypothetical protein
VFGISQQDAPSRCGCEGLWSHHFLAAVVRQKVPDGLGFDGALSARALASVSGLNFIRRPHFLAGSF